MKSYISLLIFLSISCFSHSNENAELPEPFHGTWDASLEACEEQWSDARIVINGSFIEYWESQGEVVKIWGIEPLRIKVNLTMVGEGESWVTTRSYVLSKDLNTIVDHYDGGNFLRVRCAKNA